MPSQSYSCIMKSQALTICASLTFLTPTLLAGDRSLVDGT